MLPKPFPHFRNREDVKKFLDREVPKLKKQEKELIPRFIVTIILIGIACYGIFYNLIK